MGDHARASGARTRCGRECWGIKFEYLEIFVCIICMYGKLLRTEGEKGMTTLRLQEQEQDVIESFEM